MLAYEASWLDSVGRYAVKFAYYSPSVTVNSTYVFAQALSIFLVDIIRLFWVTYLQNFRIIVVISDNFWKIQEKSRTGVNVLN